MNAHYSDQLNQAFVVSPDHLKKLVELLQDRIGKVNIRAGCVDEIEREFKTINDLIAYENSKPKRIRRLHLSAQSDDDSKSSTIVFGNDPGSSTKMSISIVGHEDVVLRLKEEVLDRLSGMRPWYSWITTIKRRTKLTIVSSIPWSIFIAAIYFEWIPVSDSAISDSVKKKIYIFTVLSCFLFMLGIWALEYFHRFLFPNVVFTIGQEKARFKLLEKIRWGVIVSFGVSFAAGLLLLIFK